MSLTSPATQSRICSAILPYAEVVCVYGFNWLSDFVKIEHGGLSPYTQDVSIAVPLLSPYTQDVSIAVPELSPYTQDVSIAVPELSPDTQDMSIAVPELSPYTQAVSIAVPELSPYTQHMSSRARAVSVTQDVSISLLILSIYA
jgi:hypothetical protein